MIKESDTHSFCNSFMTESLPYRNQSTDLQSESMDWFLYDRDLGYERVNKHSAFFLEWPQYAYDFFLFESYIMLTICLK